MKNKTWCYAAILRVMNRAWSKITSLSIILNNYAILVRVLVAVDAV